MWPFQIGWLGTLRNCPRGNLRRIWSPIIPKVLHIPQLLVSYSTNLLCMSFCICLSLFIMDGGRQVQKQTIQPPGSECDWVLCHPLNMCNRNGQNGGGVRAISIPSSITMVLLAFILKTTINGKTLWNAWRNAWKIRTMVK